MLVASITNPDNSGAEVSPVIARSRPDLLPVTGLLCIVQQLVGFLAKVLGRNAELAFYRILADDNAFQNCHVSIAVEPQNRAVSLLCPVFSHNQSSVFWCLLFA